MFAPVSATSLNAHVRERMCLGVTLNARRAELAKESPSSGGDKLDV
jgi:hypothetical protein